MNGAAMMTATTDKMVDGSEKLAALEVDMDAYLEMGDADAAREVAAQIALLREEG